MLQQFNNNLQLANTVNSLIRIYFCSYTNISRRFKHNIGQWHFIVKPRHSFFSTTSISTNTVLVFRHNNEHSVILFIFILRFANQFAQQSSTFNDSTLLIDYGVIEAYNVGLLSAHDITAEQGSSNFDVAKAMFRQADTNQDGSISREEFVNWAQNATPNPASQSYSSHGNNFNHANLFAGATPDVANILQQSGLGQAYGNYQ